MNRLLALALLLLPLAWDAYFLVAFGGLRPWEGLLGGENGVSWTLYAVAFGLTLFCWACAAPLLARGGGDTRQDAARAPAFLALGLLAWLFAQLIAIQLAGAGHGWTLPAFLSLPLLGVYPALMARGLGRPRRRLAVAIFLPVALVMDALLAWSIASGEREYIQAVLRFGGAPLVASWLILWLGWHALLAAAWIRGTSRCRRAAS